MSVLSEWLRGNPSKEQDRLNEAAFNADLDRLAAPVTTAEGEAEARPLLTAIANRAAYLRPTVRANTFATDAEAGFGLSGRAVENVDRALGSFDAGIEGERLSAIRGAMGDIAGRRQASASDILARAGLKEQQKANKPRKFLGII